MSSVPTKSSATGARYEALLEVAESIAAHRQLSTLFADLSRCLQGLVSFDFISLNLLEPKANVFRLHILQTDREVIGDRPPDTPYDQSPTGFTLRTGRQPYTGAQVFTETNYPVLLDLPPRQRYPFLCCVLPLFTAQRDLGGLQFRFPTIRMPTRRKTSSSCSIGAPVLAVAVDNALNHEGRARAYEDQVKREPRSA